MRHLALVVFIAIANCSFAQSPEEPTIEAIDGSIGVVVVKCDAAIKRVSAENEDRKPVEVTQVDEHVFVVAGPGQVWVRVTCVDFETEIFDQRDLVLNIGGTVEPLPPPDPDPDEPKEGFAAIVVSQLRSTADGYSQAFLGASEAVTNGEISSDRELLDYLRPATAEARKNAQATFDAAFEAAMPNGGFSGKQVDQVAATLSQIAQAWKEASQ